MLILFRIGKILIEFPSDVKIKIVFVCLQNTFVLLEEEEKCFGIVEFLSNDCFWVLRWKEIEEFLKMLGGRKFYF